MSRHGRFQARSLRRPVKAVALKELEILPVAGGGAVEFIWVNPSDLLVDEAYQRGLSERSAKLIRKIVGAWDWRRFKPPVCARTDQGLEIIDGQHTAIAAASHPDIGEIPVMIVEAASREERAGAFIGHNRDRLNVTQTQMHHSAVAAGDPLARQVAEVCERTGVRLLPNAPGGGVFKVNDTIAAGSITGLVRRRDVEFAASVLGCLSAAERAPITAGQIKAVEYLLTDQAYRDDVTAEGLTAALLMLGDKAEGEAAVFAASHGVPLWKGLAVVLFKHGKRRGRAANPHPTPSPEEGRATGASTARDEQ